MTIPFLDRSARLLGRLALLTGLLLCSAAGWAQTNPAPHDLSTGSFSFTGFALGTTTTYPTSMQGWSFAIEPRDTTLTSPSANRALDVSTTAPATGGIRNEVANGISLLNSASNNIGAIAVALNTSNRVSVTLGWKAQDLTSSAGRVNGLRLQYRIGNAGNFTDVASSIYLSSASGAAAEQTFSAITLPANANNKPLVQVRWLYYHSSGTGSRDRIRLDEIAISSSPDADGDGITDASDNCPTTFGQQGDACNDGDACTINDLLTNACVCAGTSALVTPTVSISIDPASSNPTCSGVPVIFHAAITNGGSTPTYEWTKGGGASVGFTDTYTDDGTSSGEVRCTITSNAACVTGSTAESNAIALVVTATPSVSISGPTAICAGGSATLTADATSGTEPFAYQWSSGETTQGIAHDNAGVKFVTITDANGCSGSASLTLVVNPTPSVSISGPTSICAGTQATLTADATSGTGPFTYQWGSGETTQSIAHDNAGVKFATITDANGCSGSASITLVVNPTPSVSISGPASICSGSFATLTADVVGGTAPFTYLWDSGETIQAVAKDEPGLKAVDVTDAAGCSASASFTLVVNPTPTVSISGPASICAGTMATLTADVTGGTAPFDYLWDSGETTPSVAKDEPGVRLVAVTDAAGCSASASFNLVVNPTPIPAITAIGPTTFCLGDSIKLLGTCQRNFPTEPSWSWTPGSETNDTITVTNGGVYTLTATDPNGCIGTSDPVTVTVNPAPIVTISGPTAICDGSSATLTINATGGTAPFDYLWDSGETIQAVANDEPGVRFATATDANGCSGTASFTVVVNPTPSATISGPTAICDGSSATLTINATGGTAPFDYLWDSGETIQAVANDEPGVRFATATDANGCSGTASFTVVVNPTPSATISGPTAICDGSSATLTINATGGTVPFDYLWDSGETIQAVANDEPGVRFATATDANGCSGTASFTVVVNPTPSATISGPTAICDGSSATLTINATGGTAPFDYLWDSGETIQAVANDEPGVRFATATDANGCSGSASFTLVVNPTPSVTISGPASICAGSTATLTASATGGTEPFSYLWDSGEVTASVAEDEPGVRIVTATDANGCSGSASFLIIINSQLDVLIAGPGPICAGSMATLTASATGGTEPFSYLWSSGETTPSVAKDEPGLYTVTVTDANGCTGSYPFDLVVNPLSTPTITAGGPTTFCSGGSVQLVAMCPRLDDPQWLWNPGGQTNDTITVTTSGVYTASTTDANGCVGTTAPVTVVVNEATEVHIVAEGPTSFCQGGSVLLIAMDADPIPPQDTIVWNPGAMTTDSIIVTTSGVYTVSLTNMNGCTATSGPVTVNVNPVPVVTISGPASICAGSTATLTASATGGTEPFSYLWDSGEITASVADDEPGVRFVTATDANGCSGSASFLIIINSQLDVLITGPGPICAGNIATLTASATGGSEPFSYLWSSGETTPSVAKDEPGLYTVTVTDANGCTGSYPFDLVVNALPSPVITADGPTSFCVGGSVILVARCPRDEPIPIIMFQWSPGGLTNDTITVTTSGVYTATATDANGCVGTSDPVTVIVNEATEVHIVATGATTFCQGGSVLLVAVDGLPMPDGDTLHWSPGAMTNDSIIVTTSGDYTVALTDTNGCTASSEPVTVIVNPAPSVTISGPASICAGSTATLTASATGGTEPFSYLWDSGEVTASVADDEPGVRFVTATDANGCSGSASFLIIINSQLDVLITGPGPICAGSTATLSASATGGSEPYSYLWSSGETTPSVAKDEPGLYTVTITDANGCTGSYPFDLVVNPLPTPVITPGGPTTFCAGGSVELVAWCPRNEPIDPNWQWDPGALTNDTITVTASGVFTATAIDVNGCVGTSDPVTVIVNEATEVHIVATGATTFCQGGSVLLVAVDGLPMPDGDTLHWSPGAMTNDSIIVTTSGDYTVALTDTNGCTASSEPVTVIVNPAPSVTINGPASICAGSTATLTASATGGTEPFSYLWDSGEVTASVADDEPGVRFVTATDANGCSGSASFLIIINSQLDVLITGPGPICAGSTATLSASATGGSEPYSYLWSSGETTPAIAKDEPGLYTVTVTDANGCTGSYPFELVVNPLPYATITALGPTTFCMGGSVLLGWIPPNVPDPKPSFQWNPGGFTTDTITVTTSGVYTLTATDNNGCTATSAPVTVTVTTPTSWYADVDGDGYGDPSSAVEACDAPIGYVANGSDDCPNTVGLVGSACDDGNASTTNDVLDANCVCSGTPVACTQNLVTLTLNTDAHGEQTSYSIVLTGTSTAVCTGSGYASNSTITAACCLPNGCYDLLVFDSSGDGIVPGGYVLRDASGKRIIDDAGNGATFTSTSFSPLGFCVPLGADAMQAASCDVETATPSTVLRAALNSAVTALYSPGTPTANANTGYQFWVTNPNGGFSRRILLTHAAPGTGWPVGTPVAQRASYFQLSAMSSAPAVPQGVLLNVRVRTRLNGVYNEFGPACRLLLPIPPCQTSQLTTTADPVVSCGATGLALSSTIYATTVAGATGYQFEFAKPGYLRRITSATRSQMLNFVTVPLQNNNCYSVRVRVTTDGGLTFCPFGPACNVTIGTATCSGSGMALQTEGTGDIAISTRLSIWPNPNDGSLINLALTDIDASVLTVAVDVTDVYGKVVLSNTIPVQDGTLNTRLSFQRDLASGLYMVNLLAGDERYTQRMIIQR